MTRRLAWIGQSVGRTRLAFAAFLVVAYLLIGTLVRPVTPVSVLAQGRADARWTHFQQASDGLVSNDVWSLAADDRSVWFGAQAGIGRYDGGWLTLLPAAEGGATNASSGDDLNVGRVLSLMQYGDAWLAGTEHGALLRWDGTGWSTLAELDAPVRALLPTENAVLIGADTGLYRLQGTLVKRDESLAGVPIYALAASDGQVWAGTGDGLYRAGGEGWDKIDHRLFGEGVQALALLGEDGLAVGTPQGVAYRTGPDAPWKMVETYDEYGKAAPVRAIAAPSPTRLWAGTDGGGATALDLKTGAREHFGYTGDPNLPTHFVRAIAVDADGSVWFATPAGVFRFQEGMWTSHLAGAMPDAPINHINDILIDSRDRVWVATGGGGVLLKDARGGQDVVYGRDAGVPETVLVLGEDDMGTVWAGGFEGAFRFDGERWVAPFGGDELPSSVVTALLGENGRLWIGTEAGLVAYDLDAGGLTEEPTLEGTSIEALALDNLERLWVGATHDGIYLREAEGYWRRFRYDPSNPDGLPGDRIVGSGLAADPEISGGMWAIVVQEGLYHWDGTRWENGDPEQRLPSSLLWTVESEANSGDLWVGSEAGVARTDRRTWGTLTAEDGLQSAVIYAVAKDAAGGYWLGGSTGLTYWLPDRTPPWVRIGRFSGEEVVGRGNALQVARGNELTLEFTAGDLQTGRDNLLVQSRLIGPEQDGAWHDVESDALQFTLATPGEYRLELQARDQSFNYSTAATEAIHVIIPPPAVEVPLLGTVPANTFRTLVVLASMVIVGSGYLSVEILRNRRRSIEAVNRSYNPYISGEPVRRDDMFFGRRELVQRMTETLHNNSIMIHGERRIGKTTLLHQVGAVLREADDPEYWFVPIYVDLEGTPEGSFFHYLIEEIWEAAMELPDSAVELEPIQDGLRFGQVAPNAYGDRLFGRDLRRITDALQGYGAVMHPGKQLRVVLLLDEMDVMSRYDHLIQQQLRRIFMRDFASTLGAVVAGIRISKEWDRVESPWYNLFNEIAVEPFSREQVLDLLIEPVRGFYRYDARATEFIVEHSLGRPYKVQQYGLEAVSHMLAQRRRRVMLDDVLAAHERIQKALEEEQAERKRAKVREAQTADAYSGEHEAGIEVVEAEPAGVA